MLPTHGNSAMFHVSQLRRHASCRETLKSGSSGGKMHSREHTRRSSYVQETLVEMFKRNLSARALILSGANSSPE
jgi:hypothetical protein